jgi:hypothetical protein
MEKNTTKKHMSNKQQTAVWWLAEQLFKDTAPTLRQRALIEEAKAMNEEQIMDAYRQGVTDEHGEVLDFSKDDSPNKYYNKKYGKA